MSRTFRHRASLALNVILAATAVILLAHESASMPAPAPSANTAADKPAMDQQPKPPRYPEAATATDKRRWLVDQLRAMGVPNNILARVVMTDLDKNWNQRGAELSVKYHGDPAKMAELQLEADMSRDTEMRAALGEAGFRQWDQENMLRQVNQGKIPLTAAEAGAAYESWKNLRQRELELEEARVKGTMDDADIGDALGVAQSAFSQQLKTMLGDERYAKSQQMDDGSTVLQQDLARANPSDSQFQELLKTQQQWNEQRLALDQQYQNDPASPDYAAQLKALDDARDQQYQQTLGADAFDALQKSQDAGYTQMKKYETLWGLNDNEVNSVYATVKYYDKAVQDYQSRASALQAQGQSVDWDAVNQNIQQFSDQTRQTLQNYLGQDTFNKMQKNGVFQLNPPQLLQHSKPAE